MIRRLALLALIPALPLAAQVGHPPERSPYGDIRPGTTIELYGGRLMGSGGPIPVGPRDGTVIGGRVLLRANSTISIGFGVWWSGAERTLLDPLKVPPGRDLGPVDVRLLAGEGLVQMNLTGGKHWHGLAPYTGLALGLVTGREAENDASGYRFGNKFHFAPVVGTRVMIGSRGYLRGEVRGNVWNLKYPSSYSLEPTDQPGTPESPNSINPTGRSGQYVLAPALLFGIGWSF